MKRYPDEDIQAIRDATDLVEVVRSSGIDLRRAGQRWKGLCPFHDEKTPSLSVSPEGYYHCFGCGESGDAISFVREVEGCSFPEALELLAERFSVKITAREGGPDERSNSSALHEVNDAASKWFGQHLLTSKAAAPARDELTKRGFDVQQAVEQFGCGYAPTSGLIRAMKDQGFSIDTLVEAGLVVKNERGMKERFQHRLLWTIRSGFGKPVGFGARRISENDPISAKFINTAETPVYRKSRVLYGLDAARREINKTKKVFVVEGYTDVMAMHLAGATNTVASCGTAFTPDHFNMLKRLVGDEGEVVFTFDGDDAGRGAALSIYDMARKSLRRLSCITPPDGLDPDDVRQQRGDEGITAMIETQRPLIETVILATIHQYPMETFEEERAALDRVLPILEHVRDPVLYRRYTEMVAAEIGYEANEVASQSKPAQPQTEMVAPDVDPGDDQVRRTSRSDLIHVLLHSREAAEQCLEAARGLYTKGLPLRVFDALDSALWDPEGEQPWPLMVTKHISLDDQRQMDSLISEPLPVSPQDAPAYCQELVEAVTRDGVNKRIAELQQAVSEGSDDEQRLRDLRELSALRKQVTAHG